LLYITILALLISSLEESLGRVCSVVVDTRDRVRDDELIPASASTCPLHFSPDEMLRVKNVEKHGTLNSPRLNTKNYMSLRTRSAF
jgi:hypothetical protein